MTQAPTESRQDRINSLWPGLPDSVKDVLLGFAGMANKQPQLLGILADTTVPRAPANYPKMLLNNTGGQVSVIDLYGNIHFANNASKNQLERLTGSRRVEHVSAFLSTEDLAKAIQLYRVVAETGERVSFVGRVDEGSELYFFTIFPLQEFADKPRKRNVIGQTVMPLAQMLKATEEFLQGNDPVGTHEETLTEFRTIHIEPRGNKK